MPSNPFFEPMLGIRVREKAQGFLPGMNSDVILGATALNIGKMMPAWKKMEAEREQQEAEELQKKIADAEPTNDDGEDGKPQHDVRELLLKLRGEKNEEILPELTLFSTQGGAGGSTRVKLLKRKETPIPGQGHREVELPAAQDPALMPKEGEGEEDEDEDEEEDTADIGDELKPIVLEDVLTDKPFQLYKLYTKPPPVPGAKPPYSGMLKMNVRVVEADKYEDLIAASPPLPLRRMCTPCGRNSEC